MKVQVECDFASAFTALRILFMCIYFRTGTLEAVNNYSETAGIDETNYVRQPTNNNTFQINLQELNYCCSIQSESIEFSQSRTMST